MVQILCECTATIIYGVLPRHNSGWTIIRCYSSMEACNWETVFIWESQIPGAQISSNKYPWSIRYKYDALGLLLYLPDVYKRVIVLVSDSSHLIIWPRNIKKEKYCGGNDFLYEHDISILALYRLSAISISLTREVLSELVHGVLLFCAHYTVRPAWRCRFPHR